MKIALVTRQRIWGGGEEFLYRLGRDLHAKGHTVTFIAPRFSPLADRVKGFPFHCTEERTNFDIAIYNDFRSLWSQYRKSAKRVYVVHGWWQTSLLRNIVARALGAHLQAVSRSVQEAVVAHGLFGIDEVGLLPLGPDLSIYAQRTSPMRLAARAQLDLTDDDTVCVCVGRPQDVKRLQLFASLANRAGMVPMLITAAPRTRAEKATLASAEATLRQGDKYRLLVGKQPLQGLVASDIFLSTSQFESLGIALMEAMAVGLPVISSAAGGPRDFIDHGRNGYLVEVGEDGAILDLLLMLKHTPDLRERIGSEAARSIRLRRGDALVGNQILECVCV